MRNLRGFVSGSMKLTDIPQPQQTEIHQQLNQILDGMMKKHHQVLIGDSYSGTDHDAIIYLNQHHYQDVVIGSTTKEPRDYTAKHNVDNGTWQSTYTPTSPSNHMAKDIDLANHADYGVGVINPTYKTRYGNDRVSQGTLRNMIQLMKQKKPAALIYYQSGHIYKARLNSMQDLDQTINSMNNPLVSAKYQVIKKQEINRLKPKIQQPDDGPYY